MAQPPHQQQGQPPQQYQQHPPQGQPGQQPYYPPQGGAPPQQGYGQQPYGQYPPQQGMAPPQGGYPPQQAYPPQQGMAPPQQHYPPQGGAYPPQGGAYPPQGGAYPPQQGYYPPQQGYGAAPNMHAGGAQCMFKVKVVNARSLVAADANGKSDPYATIRWEGTPKPYHKKQGKGEKKVKKAVKSGKLNKYQTTVQKKTLSPTWNQTFDFRVPAPVKPTDILTVEVWDYDKFGEHDFLGSAHVEMAGLLQGQERAQMYKLQGVKKGEIQLAITTMNFSVQQAHGQEGNINAHKQIAAQSSKKRAAHKKTAKAKKNVKSFGKGLGKIGKAIF